MNMANEMENSVGREVYEDIAEEYASIIDSKDANAYYEKPAMLSMMPDVAGLRILDAGCGPGVYSEWLLDHDADVTGVDYSEKMIELAKRRTGGRGSFRVADLSKPLDFFPNSTFDMVVSPLVLDYIRDWVLTLQEFNRVLTRFSREKRARNRLIQVVPYKNEWGKQFEEIRDVLAMHLSSIILCIEHVGSTSVPGLAAKPILDIDIVISKHDNLDMVVRVLSQIGYYHQGDLGIVGRETFARKDNKVPWGNSDRNWPQHHLYVCDKNCRQLISHIAFRNYLRQNPEDAKEYSNVKMRAAKNHPHDIGGYMEEKAECVEQIIRKARILEEEIAQQLDVLDGYSAVAP